MNQPPTPAIESPTAAKALRFDVVAGLTAAAVVLPKAMAYASVAGLPVAVGLYTAFVPMVIYALLGSSRVLSVSSTTTLAILAGTQLGLAVPDGDPAKLVTATATLVALVGAILMLAAALRLGFVANFISTPVLTGFKAGIGLVIVLDQVPKLLGIHITKHGFFADLLSVAQQVAGDIAADVGRGRRHLHRADRHGAALAALAGATGRGRGRHRGVMVLRSEGARRVDRRPDSAGTARADDARSVAGRTTAAGCVRHRVDELHGDDRGGPRVCAASGDPPLKANRELIATGAANLGGALFGAMPAGGGTSQTLVVTAAGGRSQKASLVTAGAALATMLLLAPLLGLMPNATLAAVVIVYSVGLIKPSEFREIRNVRTMEFRWALIACLGVLVFGTLTGIVVAIIVSTIGLASQVANPRVSVIGRKRGADVLRPLSPEHPDDETFEGLLILRPEGRLFFANAQNVADQISALVTQYQPRVLALDMSRVPDIEYSALQALMEGERRATDRSTTVWLAALNPSVLEVARRAGLDERLGRERLLFNARAVIERFQAQEAQQAAAGTAVPGPGTAINTAR